MTPFSSRILLAMAGLFGSVAAAAPLVSVTDELQRLMDQHAFEVRGIEQTQDALGRSEGDALVPRLRALLDGFDHVIVQSASGGVERVIILGEKVAVVAPVPSLDPMAGAEAGSGTDPIVLPTRRQGASHLVGVGLEGPDGKRLEQALLIDTGADRVVLPESLIASLGLSPERLEVHPVQTANGIVEARIGTLDGVWLAEQRVSDVAVAFIADERLGGNALLGMSVLGRYVVTIDDEHGQVLLKQR
ncbi:MAG: peptidase A2A [Sphingobacteriia bacterium]|nr:peptidase A2A [Sphingobacteriia bacterium]NCC40024.1 peptidase A2A [Gammaproteobacteria bacterium]